jgi:predicted RND superfamily exporter protein
VVFGIILTVLIGLLAVAVLIIIVGYGIHMTNRYRELKKSARSQSEVKATEVSSNPPDVPQKPDTRETPNPESK